MTAERSSLSVAISRSCWLLLGRMSARFRAGFWTRIASPDSNKRKGKLQFTRS